MLSEHLWCSIHYSLYKSSKFICMCMHIFIYIMENLGLSHGIWNTKYLINLTHWGRDKMATFLQTTFPKCMYFNEIVWIAIKISLNFANKGPIYNIPALIYIMDWCRPGDKPLSRTVMVKLPTHILSLSLKELKVILVELNVLLYDFYLNAIWFVYKYAETDRVFFHWIGIR